MSYSIQDIVSWYQKKIGTYDKQQWEKTVEQRILRGLTHVPMRTAKLKTEFIDVDLVRGSAFTKTKPKHGWLKVTNLATLRLLLLPFYYNWWISQTSTHIFCLLLVLYSLQLISTALFAYVCLINDPTNILGNISASEVLAPIAMMLVLSITHSQIVSTHATASSKKSDHQRNSVATAACRRIKRTKRRSTCVRSRPSHDYSSDSKLPCDIPIDKSNEPNETKYNSKRNRVKSDMPENSPRNRNCRNVVWDTTPVKINQRSRMYKDREDNGSSSLVNNCAINQQVEKSRCLSASDIRQIGGVDRMQVPETEEQEPTSPSLDDDGFESLDGSGSSDGIQEDKDISLSAAEYESVAKIQGSPSHIINLNLVSNNICPPIKSLHFKLNGSPDSNMCNEDVNNRIEIGNDNSSAKSNKHGVTDLHPLINSTLDERIRSYESNEDFDDAAGVNSKAACCRQRQQIHSQNRLAGVAKRTLESGSPNNLKVNEDVETDDSETESVTDQCVSKILLSRSAKGQSNITNKPDKIMAESSVNSSGDESEVEGVLSSPGSFCPLMTEGTTSAGEWIGVTTNSEECSYSSEIDGSDNQYEQQFTLTSDNNEHPLEWELDMIPNVILNPTNTASGKVSCTMWEKKEVKKANLSVLDVSSTIIARVEAMPENMDYLYIGVVMSVLLAFLPSACRLTESLYEVKNLTGSSDDKMLSINHLFSDSGCPVFVENLLRILSNGVTILHSAFGVSVIGNIVIIIAIIERFCLATIFFFLLTVAERTFKQRFLYAKFFSHLTSFRRARKSELPHFRLNKVRNIKTWLSVRSYLKKRGPQRSVDVIVSSAFLTAVLLISFLSVELLKDSEYNVEVLGWCIVIGFFILRFMTLGTKINRKYRNLSTIITEQINLYLQIEQKPNKKEELMVANSVLKLAADLLKELESPFKISGFSANPYLYTVTKVVMLSALSGILSEILGFKLKLHKIKIK